VLVSSGSQFNVTPLRDTTEFLNEDPLICGKSAISPIVNAPSRPMCGSYVSSKWNLQLSTSGSRTWYQGSWYQSGRPFGLPGPT